MIAPTPRFNVETSPSENVIFPDTFFSTPQHCAGGDGGFLQFFHATNFHRFEKSHFRAKMGFENCFCNFMSSFYDLIFFRDFWKSG